jgi:starch phosphorylase
MINYILTSGHGVADPFMCLMDFDSYMRAYGSAVSLSNDTEAYRRKSLRNIAAAGFFSSDRSIREYADRIWHISPVR